MIAMKMLKKTAGWVGLLVLLLSLVTGCRSGGADPVFSSGPDLGSAPAHAGDPLGGTSPSGTAGVNSGSSTVFNVGDLVNIIFIGPDASSSPIPVHEERIKDDGTITLQLIGSVKAAGKSAGELQREIHDLYVPKYYLRLTVIVKTQDLVYYVGGEVKQPNRQQYIGKITVTKAIKTAGDFTDWANKKKVMLTRADGKTVLKLNCVKILENQASDPEVFPGDKIYVPRRMW